MKIPPFREWVKLNWFYHPPTKLVEGIVFIGVCHSVNKRGVVIFGSMSFLGAGGLGISGTRSLQGSMPRGWVPTPDLEYYRVRSASGWNTSYWNAFLCWLCKDSSPIPFWRSENITDSEPFLCTLKQFQCSSALPDIKYNCALLFPSQFCIGDCKTQSEFLWSLSLSLKKPQNLFEFRAVF